MKRILAMLLAVVMVVGLIPATVFAAETVLDAAIFCSDVHGSTSDLTSVLGGVAKSGVDYSSIGFVGDTCLTVANTTSIVQSALSDTDIEVMFSYASSHDTEDGADISTNWDYSGEVEGVSNYYLVYTIRETDMQNASGASTAAPAFTSWYNGLTAAQKKLPIFIMSHRPLHDRRDDNAGAATWYDAISAAAESSDIVFFWAHNHTSESDVDTAAYYVAKDGTETFTVYNGDTVTPNFTYMNAGYINANNQKPARLGVATTVQITANSLIFQDYNSSGTYTGTYAHNVTVEREFAAEEVTLSSIAISGTTSYYVGDTLDLTVTATYSDGNTKDVTSAATLSGYDLSTAGTQTVTATYEGLTATTSITVNEVQLNSIAVTTQPTKVNYVTGEALDTTGMVVTATYNNGTTAEVTGWYTSTVDMTTAGTKEVTVNYMADGITFKTTFTITVEQGVAEGVVLESIEITKDPDKTEYLLSQELALDGMVVVATFSDDSTVELQYKPFSTSTIYGGYELDNFSMYVEKNHEMVVTYTFGEVTRTASTTINVWNEDFTDKNTGVKVHVADADYGVTTLNVSPSSNSYVATAVKDFIKDGTLVAYDITLTLDTDGNYALTNGNKTVTLPIPSGVNNPVVYYVSDDGATVTNMNAVKDGNGNVTFTTTHFSTYVIGESTEIEVPKNETATGSGTTTTTTTETKEVYVLVDSISAAGDYLIVNTNTATTSANMLTATNSGVTNTSGVTVVSDKDADGNTVIYIEDPAAAAIWTASGSSTWTLYNSSLRRYLRYNSGLTTTSQSNSATSWYSDTNVLYARQRSQSSGGPGGSGSSSYTYYYVRYNSSWTATSSTSTTSNYPVYFYQKQEVKFTTTTTTTVSGTYKIEGEDIALAVSEGTTANLKSTLTFTPDSGTATTTDVSTAATYEIVTVDTYGNTVDGDPNGILVTDDDGNLVVTDGKVTFTGNYGTALVKVSYTTDFGVVTDYITIEAKAPYYTIDLHYAEMTKATDVTADNFANGTYYTFDSVTNTYDVATEYVEGTTYYTTPVVQGDEITETVALKGIEEGDTYAVWAVVQKHTSAGAEDMGELGNALTWTVSDTSIADIDTTTGVITFTGSNYGTFTVTVSYKGADGKVITDTITISVTDSLYVVPGDGTNDFPEYPNEGAVRFDKTATAVGNYSETGIAMVELSMTGVPYTTGSELDVVVMLDMSTSMDDDRIAATVAATKVFIESIVKNEDGSYNSNRVYVGYFNGDTVYTITGTDNIGGELASVDNDTEYNALIAAIEDEYDGALTASGTNYDVSLEECYNVLTEAKSTNLPPEAETAADYSRQQFVVFMSDGGPTDYATSASNVVSESTIVDWFNVSDSDSANWTNSMTEEYWSGLMKDNGVTIYSVGLILQEAPTSGPQDYRDYSADQNYYVTSTLLTSIASGADYFFNCESATDTAEMESIFSNIATEIHEAATNVVVEDKIGSSYTMNFSLPGYNTDNQLDSTALDGLSNFYIQVVDYVLDSTTHERTDTYTVLENFTFNLDGSLKSHTVDGAACGDTCSHVTTTTDGVITAIDGTYFDYKSDSTGEYLTWTAEKLNENELALQYFAYLDNSSGVAEADQIPAGTYYTNEYATLTYTNVNGNQVQQEFPVPQMTWYGAQVSYVFYLVNEAGQPVNRAGRVVPFAEAVYVTDVYTEAVVWNDLEQSAGLEAERLAEELVPDVYALYDNDASYNIHVYADEDGVNLNNHFVIGGDVTDDYNTATNSWTNAKTTYVFNNKSDGTKYNIVGAYIANDGNDTTTTTTYLCKGEGTISDVTWGEVTLTSDSDLVNGAYYYDVNGVKTRALTYVEGTTYYELTGASYTAASGETHWTPGTDDSTTGGTVINNHVYYVDEYGNVYTIVQKSDGTEVREGFDFANTTVAFAVVWKPQLEPDTVVVDFGLDVVIDVIANDAMAAGVKEVQTTQPNATINSGTYTRSEELTTSVDLPIGTATVENLTSVRFSLNETNGMQFNAPAVFYYEADVNYYTYDASNNATLNTTSMYSSVTVIPATTVYYEDSFVTYAATNTEWSVEGTASNKTQDVDRPGENKLNAAYDADNVYGYDSAYETVATYSMGAAHKVHVDANSYGTATFSFYGTGFDVIGMTSNDTGVLAVKVVKEGETKATTTKIVDTYYGYAYGNVTKVYTYTWLDATDNLDGTYSWVLTSSAATTDSDKATEIPANPVVNDTYTVIEEDWYPVDAETDTDNNLYQVPVIKVENLPYAKYTVTITATYMKAFDHTTEEGYDLYLDAIRIYDPTGVASNSVTNDEVSNAYKDDGEGWPTYMELRDRLLTANDFEADLDTTVLTGAMFIDGIDTLGDARIADYTSYGPNNEVYLAPGQGVAFALSNADHVHVGMRRMTGTATYTIESYDEEGKLIKSVTGDVTSATDMYYDITDLKDGTIVIRNSGTSGELMLTNLKYTFESNPATAQVAMFMTMRRSAAVLGALNSVDTDSDKTDDTVTGETETDDTVVEDTNNTDNNNTVVEDTNNTENNDPVVEDTNTENDDTIVEDTDTNAPAEDVPEEEIPEEDSSAEDETTGEAPAEQLGFWARLWNAIKNAFNRLFSWFGF